MSTHRENTAVARQRQAAVEFIAFCDGLEAAGMAEYARRGRNIARDLRDALDALGFARSYTVTVTADRDRWRDERWRQAHGQPFPA